MRNIFFITAIQMAFYAPAYSEDSTSVDQIGLYDTNVLGMAKFDEKPGIVPKRDPRCDDNFIANLNAKIDCIDHGEGSACGFLSVNQAGGGFGILFGKMSGRLEPRVERSNAVAQIYGEIQERNILNEKFMKHYDAAELKAIEETYSSLLKKKPTYQANEDTYSYKIRLVSEIDTASRAKGYAKNTFRIIDSNRLYSILKDTISASDEPKLKATFQKAYPNSEGIVFPDKFLSEASKGLKQNFASLLGKHQQELYSQRDQAVLDPEVKNRIERDISNAPEGKTFEEARARIETIDKEMSNLLKNLGKSPERLAELEKLESELRDLKRRQSQNFEALIKKRRVIEDKHRKVATGAFQALNPEFELYQKIEDTIQHPKMIDLLTEKVAKLEEAKRQKNAEPTNNDKAPNSGLSRTGGAAIGALGVLGLMGAAEGLLYLKARSCSESLGLSPEEVEVLKLNLEGKSLFGPCSELKISDGKKVLAKSLSKIGFVPRGICELALRFDKKMNYKLTIRNQNPNRILSCSEFNADTFRISKLGDKSQFTCIGSEGFQYQAPIGENNLPKFAELKLNRNNSQHLTSLGKLIENQYVKSATPMSQVASVKVFVDSCAEKGEISDACDCALAGWQTKIALDTAAGFTTCLPEKGTGSSGYQSGSEAAKK